MSKPLSGRERTALYRARSAERNQIAQERDALIKEYGEQFLNLEHTNKICQMALHILEFFHNKPSKINQANVEEAIDIVSRWLDKNYETGWDILPDYPDQWRTACCMGLLPATGHVREYFANLYQQYQAAHRG